MKTGDETEVRSRLQELRESRGISAAELARLAGISRQTVYAIQDGTFVPNTTVALLLARALHVSVEEIFSLPEEGAPEPFKAELLTSTDRDEEVGLVRTCYVGERLIAVPASLVPAYLPQADAHIDLRTNRGVTLTPGSAEPARGNRLVIAGCDPALSVLSEFLQSSGMDIITIPCSSRRALEWLKQGKVHAAGSHLLDRASGEYNVPALRKLFSKPDEIRIVTFANWEQGLVVRSGNPKNIRCFADLARKDVTVMNREKGSGSRDLLDRGVRQLGMEAEKVRGYQSLAKGHIAAASSVAAGSADCCIAPRSAARCFGLDFVPLAAERFDLSFSASSLELPATKALLEVLNRSQLHRKLRTIAGYDTTHTGRALS